VSDFPTGTVTVMFTDLVGSTAERDRLGDAAADTVRRVHDHALREAIESCGGRIVKSTGDGFMAAFAGAADGVRAAVQCQRAAQRAARQAATPFEIRIGVSVGDVELDAGDYFGLSVVQAARLCDAARGGEILVTDLIRTLAGTWVDFSYGPPTAMSLKGISADVVAHRVDWHTGDLARPPFPTALRSDDELQFVGRADELDVLYGVYKRVEQGERRVVLLGGEPGIGKTRLASQAARDAYEAGAVVLLGVCDEDLGVPYQPFAEALTQYVTIADDAARARHLRIVAADLEQLAPGLAADGELVGVAPADDVETARYRMFTAYRAFLESVATDAPVVLVLDDLHWAASPTLLLLKHVIRAGDPFPLMLIGTYRDTELDRRHPLAEMLAELRRNPSVTRVAIRGLERVAVAELCAAHDVADSGLVGQIADETEGNPFFVGEVLRHVLSARDDHERHRVPEGVKEAVGRRLNLLAPDAEQLLTVGAVIGPEFSLDLAVAAAGVEPSDAERAADAACGLRFLVELERPRWYRFPHAIVRAAILDELTTNQRIRWHRAIAEHLESSSDDSNAVLTDLAHHYCEAAPGGDVDKAVHYCTLAAEQAMRASSALEAALWYERALDVLPVTESSARVIALSLAAGKACNDGAQYRRGLPHFERAYERAEAIGDLDGAFGAACEAGGLSATWIGTSIEAPVEHLRAVQKRVEGDPSREAMVVAKLANWYAMTDPVLADQYVRRALALCERSDDVSELFTRMTLASPLMIPSLLADAFANVERLEELALAFGIEQVTKYVMQLDGPYTYTAGLAREHLAVVEQCRLAGGLQPPTFQYFIPAWDANVSVMRGREDEFRRLAEDAVLLIEVQAAEQIYARTHWRLAAETGRGREDARALMQEVTSRCAPASMRLQEAWEAEAALVMGDTGPAEVMVDRYGADPDAYPPALDLLSVGGSLVGMAIALGRHDELRVFRQMLEPYADLMGGQLWSWEPAIAHELGRVATALEEFDVADSCFARALELHEAFGAPLMVAKTHLEWGRACAGRGERTTAREHFEHAADIAAQCSFGALSDETSQAAAAR